jgi:hypothetical protein
LTIQRANWLRYAPPEKEQIWGLQFFDRHTVFAMVSLPNSTKDPVQQAG